MENLDNKAVELISKEVDQFIESLSQKDKSHPYSPTLVGMAAARLLAINLAARKDETLTSVSSLAASFAASIYLEVMSTYNKKVGTNEDSGNTFSDFPSDDVRPH